MGIRSAGEFFEAEQGSGFQKGTWPFFYIGVAMAKIDPNLLIDQEWTGTFFPPERKDLSFAGRLKYSPTNGVRLEYARSMNLSERDLKWDFLHGHTSTGMPLTLVGEFSTEGSGFSFNHGMHYWTSTGHPFRYAIFGYHFDSKDTFDSFDFDMTGVQDFFAPEGDKHYIPYSKDDVVSAKCGLGRVRIMHSATFNFVSDDLTAHFYSDDIEAMNELQQAYVNVRVRHPNFHPYLKKNLEYLFRFVPKKDLSILDAYPTISSITALFSLLAFEPVRLTKLFATARDEDGKPHPMTVFPFTVDDLTTVERSLTKRSFHGLPLNNSDVNLGSLICNWIEQCDRYSSLTSMLQSMTNTVAVHESHGSIVLSSTQLEDMAIDAGFTSKADKYEYGLNNHASEKLRKVLAMLLECGEEEIGKAISDLRSEIAHVHKTRKYLNKLGNRRVYQVSRALQLLVIGYVLEQVGASKSARDKYQDALIV